MNDLLFNRRDVEAVISLLFSGKPGEQVLDGFLADCVAESAADIAVAARLTEGNAWLKVFDPYGECESAVIEAALRTHLGALLAAPQGVYLRLAGSDDALRPLSRAAARFGMPHCLLFLQTAAGTEPAAVLLIRKEREFSQEEMSAAAYPAALAGMCLMALHALTEQQRLQQLLSQRAKLDTLGKLAAGIAHDVSNILAGIFGSTALLKRKYGSLPDAAHLIEIIESSSLRARDLTRGLLSYGKTTPRQKDLVQPLTIVAELETVLRETLPQQIRFECHTVKHVKPVMGNSTQLYQVLMNLCVNARDAITGNGSLILGVKSITVLPAQRHPAGLKEGEYVHFFVQDSGKGIPRHLLNKIFDPYFSTRETEGGTGLGLYIVYGIIQAHNGVITVQSEEGVGTGFDIYIPAAMEQHHEAKYADPVVIIADDEVVLRDLLAELLESSGYYVIAVGSGEDALHVLTEELQADVVVVDYQMGGMNGLEMIRRARELGITVPVILSTGSAGVAMTEGIEGLLINKVLVKPYDFEEMLASIKAIV